MARRPTEAEVVQALGDLLDAYSTIDEMLDCWASAGPEGMTADEKRRQREAGRVRAKATRVWQATRRLLPPSM